MNDRAVSLFANYDFEVEKTRKGRGMLIAKTPKGMFELVEFQGSLQHLMLEYGLLENIKDSFFHPVDRIIKTKEDGLFCSDYEGKKYIVKNYIEGRECNVFCPEELSQAMQSMALLHLTMRNIEIPVFEESEGNVYSQITWENMQKAQDEAEFDEKMTLSEVANEHVAYEYKKIEAGVDGNMSDKTEEKQSDIETCEEGKTGTEEHMKNTTSNTTYKNLVYDQADDILDEFSRRNKELSRARNYIRKKSGKDDFELYFLKVYDSYFEQTLKASELLTFEEMSLLKENQLKRRMYAHGDCSQHNSLLTKEGITFINFEKCGAHLQIKDVYMFLRKVLEKNNWSVELGKRMIDAYRQVLPLDGAEMKYLTACFMYPEKFWKIANTYLNRRKSLLTGRQMEKLLVYEEKEEARQIFIKKLLMDVG